jgi:hypothetical protein
MQPSVLATNPDIAPVGGNQDTHGGLNRSTQHFILEGKDGV